MKKILFYAIATAMLGMTFTSCDKENEDENLKGTFTYQNDSLSFSFENKNAYDALIIDGDYKGWFVGDGAFDPETLELTYTEEYPYRWYVMEPEQFELDVDFLSSFEFKLIDGKTARGGQMDLEFIKR